MTQMPVIEQVFQLKGHHIKTFPYFHTSMDMDDPFAPEPLHRHVMLSAAAEEH